MNPEFYQQTEIALSDNSTWNEKRNALIALHNLFVTMGAADALDSFNEEEHTWLPSGFAINPVSAGVCMLEVNRTQSFVAALKEAITDRLKKHPGKTVHVLDAGCGPYALLCLLTIPFFTPQQVQFTVLDVFENNLSSVRKLVTELSVEPYFCETLLEDAAVYQIPTEKEIHIVISETMKSALFKEPQAAITLNLAPQLPAGGVFIPRKIDVDLRMVHRRLRNDWRRRIINIEDIDYSQFETPIGNVLTLSTDQKNGDLLHQNDSSFMVPEHFNPDLHHLELFTTITLYKDQLLTRYNSSITLPVTLIKHFEHSIEPGSILHFRYQLTGVPGLRFECAAPKNKRE